MSIQVTFKNKYNDVKITRDYVIYNDISTSIVTSYFFSKTLGKVSTEEKIFKWSKKELHIYDITGGITFIERMPQIQENNSYSVNDYSVNNVKNNDLIETYYFQITSDKLLKFEIFQSSSLLTEIFNPSSEAIELNELNISKHVKEYISTNKEILFIDNKNNRYRWKNIPIGKM